jgi:omega-hydroxy-beta-dihydromenaquinone-9 sulfotransferase
MPFVRPTSGTPTYSRTPLRAYRFWQPRFWHGMQLPTWLRLLLRNRFAVSPSRWHMAAAITGVSALNSFASVFDQLMYSHRVRHTKLAEPPLFVLGHWRSGTTLLHELLILDPRHTYPTTYECFVPHHFLWTEWWLTPWTRWVLPATRPMDDVETDWDRPQEDEFALCNLGVPSPYLVWAFPNHGPVYDDYLDLQTLSTKEREQWKQTWRTFVQRIATLRNRRIVLKSPTHTARIRTLLEVFPDARFVHIVRDPLVIFPSTVRLWKSLSQVQGLQVPNQVDAWLESNVLETFVRMYERFEQDRDLVPANRLVDVRYEDLVADPVGQMRRIYNEIELGDFRPVAPAVSAYAANIRGYRPNEYELPRETADRVRRSWAPYFQRYGYREPSADAASA